MPNAYTPDYVDVASPLGMTATKAAVSGRKIGLLSLVIGAAFSIWSFSIASGITPFVVAVACWIAAPYVVIAITGLRISIMPATVMLGVALAVAAIFGVWAFDAVDEDAQGALVLLFAPAYQLVGVVIAAGIILTVDFMGRRRARKHLVA
ncbi:MAG: hypothetical protein H6822_08285 [Planctomycetaceae bacterium]|nr:hypothetical protein [Planctomycetales bacterium]MCB9922166.1 hypothetical protein [Planctomycetaceae bacterium]